MASQQNSDEVKILLFKRNNCLIIKYSMTKPDDNKYCRDYHKNFLKRSKNFKSKLKEGSVESELQIKCGGIEFQAESTGSSRVQTKTDTDAYTLKEYFFQLDSWVISNEDPDWPWAFCLNDAYDREVWEEGVQPKAGTKRSASQKGSKRRLGKRKPQ
jgi:hypothetical protein